MRYKVINLNRTPERLREFRRINHWFSFERFEAIDGKLVDRTKLVELNLMTLPTSKRYTDGAVGVAMSHRALWQECIESNESFTIIEDDAYLNPDIKSIIEKYTDNDNWDFIFWGSNLDQWMGIELIPGITTAHVTFDHPLLLKNINQITKIKIENPVLYRCYWGVGLVCYSINPKSAKYLLDVIFPLKDYFDFRDNFGIDNSIIEELQNMKSFMCMPPLVLTKNDRLNSTIQNKTPPRIKE
jgi:hypothetical protein